MPLSKTLVELVWYQPFEPAAGAGSRWGPARYAACVLQREGVPTWRDLGEAAPIGDLVQSVRKAFGEEGSDARPLARALDSLTMAPVRKLLGEARTILLAPDGALNLVPFGALVDENGRYLVERYTFTYLTSGRDLLQLGEDAPSATAPVVMAAPDFDAGGGAIAETESTGHRTRSADLGSLRFGPLRGTAAEARSLEPLLAGAQVWTGAGATEGRLKQLHAPRILHIATHGFFLEDEPESLQARRELGQTQRALRTENPLLRSGLALAGANQRQSSAEDGILTALEASGLDLHGTQLVVLSACETGLGEVRDGEGVYGLRRALAIAGAQSQVMSLWKVDDAATRDLMVAYYRRLLRGEGRSEALRSVQLAMLRGENSLAPDMDRAAGSGGQWRHPFFWASFISLGDWRPLTTTTKSTRMR